jgi:hypothetical protein
MAGKCGYGAGNAGLSMRSAICSRSSSSCTELTRYCRENGFLPVETKLKRRDRRSVARESVSTCLITLRKYSRSANRAEVCTNPGSPLRWVIESWR